MFGMTRGGGGIKTVESYGAKAVLGNYTDALDLSKALSESGAKMVFMITDTFKAAKGKAKLEVEQVRVQHPSPSLPSPPLPWPRLPPIETVPPPLINPQGKIMIQTFVKAKVDFVVFCSVIKGQ